MVLLQSGRKTSMKDAQEVLDHYDVPNGPIYSIEDIMKDVHFRRVK